MNDILYYFVVYVKVVNLIFWYIIDLILCNVYNIKYIIVGNIMEHKVTKKQRLLDDNGVLTEPGYSTELIFDYDRKDIKASKLLIKEWDYYLITNKHYAVALTIADNGYMGLLSASIIDYDNKTEITQSVPTLFPLGKFKAPTTSVTGSWAVKTGRAEFSFMNDGTTRHLTCHYKKFKDGKDLTADFVLTDVPKDSMVIATPFFEKANKFYYNQKINCISAKGSATLGDKVYTFDDEYSLAVLDWGRGVWSYNNTWYWGSMNTRLPNGDKFGFNIGYGFGNTDKATENMVFINGIAHKLDNVTFNIPLDDKGKDDYLSDWTFTSNDGRFEMKFKPILDRSAIIDAKLLCSIQHQIFGRFTGKVILDNGDVVEINDEIGFAEKVHNKW